MGPCALEYTKLKTSDHFWTDPSANELVQRHRIHGAHRCQDASAGRRPALGVSAECRVRFFPVLGGGPAPRRRRGTALTFLLSQIRKRQSSVSMSDDRFAASAREYVESLHQNSRSHLLYGKNNVLVQPVRDL